MTLCAMNKHSSVTLIFSNEHKTFSRSIPLPFTQQLVVQDVLQELKVVAQGHFERLANFVKSQSPSLASLDSYRRSMDEDITDTTLRCLKAQKASVRDDGSLYLMVLQWLKDKMGLSAALRSPGA